jgi:protein O-mannosyl-transferase
MNFSTSKLKEAFARGLRGITEHWRVALLLAVATLVYGNSLLNSFTYDDEAYILNNPVVKTLSLHGLFQPNRASNLLRPVTFASFGLNWAIAGVHAFSYHLFNVLGHAVVVLLLYLVLCMLLESVPRATTIAFAAALLFAVHPIHTEAVASITGRSELLAAGFLLSAWLLHLHDRRIPALACLVLAMMSKESAAVFLPLALAGDYARGRLKQLLSYASLAGVTSLYLGIFWKLEGGRFGEKKVAFVDNPLASFPVVLRIPNALRVGWKYLSLQLYPSYLSFDYSYNAILLYVDWRRLAPVIVGALLLLALWIWALWTGRKEWFLAGAIYLGGFAATANILLPTGTIMGERLAYLPSTGFCLLVALIWARLEKRKQTLAWAVLVIVVAVLAARTVVRNRVWRDNLSLFSADIRTVPGSARAHVNLGYEFMQRNQLEAARAEFQTAMRIFPDFPSGIENYGLVESRMGQDEEALRLFLRAQSVMPRDSLDYDLAAVNLASQLMKLGRNDEALNLLNQIILEQPDLSPAWSDRSFIRYQRGELPSARSDAEAALRLDSANSQARRLLSALDGPVSTVPVPPPH